MAETTTPARPAWLEVGAQVICWTTGGAAVSPGYRLGTVTKINVKSFRVDVGGRTAEPLFPIEDDGAGRHSKRGPGAWSTTRHAAHRASRVGCLVEQKMREQASINRATDAVVAWQRDKRNRTALDAAIHELQLLRTRMDDHLSAAAKQGRMTPDE